MSDTGAGMDEETRKNIFEPFFTTKGSKGTGLGLATVYGIVRQSQGWIDVISKPGQGSIFRIHLPRVDETGAPTSSTPLTRAAPGGSETILVVEDQEEVREFIVNALSDRGYSVLSAADGEHAIELADRHPGVIDVLLTDVVLPGINGREVADHFVAIRPAIKVIFTSGYAQDLIADRGVLHSSVDYIPKPYTADQIVAKVREVVHRR
jgi:two-component system, cell cycle sensor histidine kinase and response regulator CckA